MKVEIDIPVEEFDYYDYEGYEDGNHAKSFVDIIIDRVAEQLLAKVCCSSEKDINKMLSDRINNLKQTIENRMVKELTEDTYATIRDSVTEKVVADTASKYERSNQYRDIKKKLELESDSAITNGMRSLISDIVRAEVKKIIKL